MKRSLDEAYGSGQVNLVSAVFRWMNHHSKLQPQGQSVPGTNQGCCLAIQYKLSHMIIVFVMLDNNDLSQLSCVFHILFL